MKNQDAQFLIECLTIELAQLLMAEYGWEINRALDELYNSATYRKVEDERSGFYYQSCFYAFQYLKHEMETGIMA